jgi:hypothetical protein
MKASLSAPDLGNLLGVTERTLRRWEEDGTGPKRVVENLEPVYPLEILVVWLRKHRPDVKLGAAADIVDAKGRLALLQGWEKRVCVRYKLKSTEELYEAVRHADFHETGSGHNLPDKIEDWNLSAYAAFSGVIVRHRLSPEQLRDLLAEFRARHDFGLAAKKNMSAAEFVEEIDEALTEAAFKALVERDGPDMRQVRDHVAIAHRYACACARKYYPPPANPHVMADLAELEKREASA